MDFYKMSWIQYYIREPWKRLRWRVRVRFLDLWADVSGRWWCEGCQKHHAARVLAYYPDGETGYCYEQMRVLAEDCAFAAVEKEENGVPDPEGALRKLIAGCEHIAVGRKNVTREVKREFEMKARPWERRERSGHSGK